MIKTQLKKVAQLAFLALAGMTLVLLPAEAKCGLDQHCLDCKALKEACEADGGEMAATKCGGPGAALFTCESPFRNNFKLFASECKSQDGDPFRNVDDEVSSIECVKECP